MQMPILTAVWQANLGVERLKGLWYNTDGLAAGLLCRWAANGPRNEKDQKPKQGRSTCFYILRGISGERILCVCDAGDSWGGVCGSDCQNFLSQGESLLCRRTCHHLGGTGLFRGISEETKGEQNEGRGTTASLGRKTRKPTTFFYPFSSAEDFLSI